MSATATSPKPSVTASPGQRLMQTMAAVRLSFVWMGIRKTLNADQKAQAAEPFGAEGRSLAAAKKILNTEHPMFRTVTAVKNRIVAYWKGMSVPFPETGIRLIRQDHVDQFNSHMVVLREELQEAVGELCRCYEELRAEARQRLGSLFNPADYPPTLVDLFEVTWDFPSVEAPSYLKDLNPELYEQECRRMSARFEEAVKLAEEAFTEEFGKLVAHLTERLTGAEDGKPKTFRDSLVGNLREFFDKFRMLDVRSNDQLDELVETAQQAISGVRPQDLRNNQGLRAHIATQLSAVQASLDHMLVDRPRRRILRPQQGEAA